MAERFVGWTESDVQDKEDTYIYELTNNELRNIVYRLYSEDSLVPVRRPFSEWPIWEIAEYLGEDDECVEFRTYPDKLPLNTYVPVESPHPDNVPSDWAFEQVGQVQRAGIMGGVGSNTFAPKDSYTREQSILTMVRLWKLITANGE